MIVLSRLSCLWFVLIATAVAFVLKDMGQYLVPYLFIVDLVNDSFAKDRFINILLTVDSELILDDVLVIFKFSDNISC